MKYIDWKNKKRLFILFFGSILLLSGCGGGGGGGSATPAPAISLANPAIGMNVLPISIGPGVNNNVNIPVVSVTVCKPKTTQCQIINNVLVDTGSYGLRLFSSNLNIGALSSLDYSNVGTSLPALAECVQFADGYTFGPVVNLDVYLTNQEQALNIPVNIIDDQNSITVPDTCSSQSALNSLQSPTLFGANGVLGIGDQSNDSNYSHVINNYSLLNYYSCPNKVCTQISYNQINPANFPFVANPVVKLNTADNNGLIIVLPSINSPTGAQCAVTPYVCGTLILGINTQTNNTLPSNTNFINLNNGYFTSIINNVAYTTSFIDSGSNGYFFNASPSIGMCSSSNWSSFYCLSPPQGFSAIFSLINNQTTVVSFSIGDPTSYSSGAYAFDNLAGPQLIGSTYNNSFDWGLPFFFGKSVFIGISGTQVKSTPSSTSFINTPFIAFK